ncbi:MAG TPA: efflux RND transporter periplasmic adaptor subunit [Polyangiaceae bacterium]|nr:efflux RND transporter periplasmic adaptor subunit [Polyangiaceae bacterium]
MASPSIPARSHVFAGLIAFLSVIEFASGCTARSDASQKAAPAVPVSTALVAQQDVPVEVKAFGTVEASHTVDIVSQVTGLITKVHFKEGDFVKAGDLLFTVDTRPYRASLAVAQAEVSRNEALAEQAESEAARSERLQKEGLVSEQQLAKAAADAASARANVAMGRAQAQSASLNVSFTRIVSPLDGRTGTLLVHAGNVVHANDPSPLLVIRSLSPIFVRFSVPQELLPSLRAGMEKEPLRVRATTRGPGGKTAEGPLTFLENTVDAATGTLALKATFANTGLELWPGAAVDVVLQLGVDKQALVVPDAAVQVGQSGSYAFVVGKDGRAEQRNVEVLRSTGKLSLIRSGLSLNEQVVVDGQVRLRNGTKVSVKPPSDVSVKEKKAQTPGAQ